MKPIPVVCTHRADTYRRRTRIATIYGDAVDMRLEGDPPAMVHTPSDLLGTAGGGTNENPFHGTFASYQFKCRCGQNPRVAAWELQQVVHTLRVSGLVTPIDISRLNLFGLRDR